MRTLQTNEETLHEQVCDYLRLRYPTVLFRTDFAAGLHLSLSQAVKHKRLQAGRAWPDLFLAEPRGKYHGLFLELKRSGTRIFLRDGSLTANAHIQEQYVALKKLRQRGYRAEFVVGFEEAISLIDSYLKLGA